LLTVIHKSGKPIFLEIWDADVAAPDRSFFFAPWIPGFLIGFSNLPKSA
jgi:hypothetical protein